MQGGGSPPRERGARGQTQHPERRRRFTPAWAGSTKQWVPYGPVVPGSPPRGRGAPSGCSPLADRGRFTPAWAGSTRPAASPRARPPVHPRVGGEHELHRRLRGRRPGSPPRGRGAPTKSVFTCMPGRFTPAWAGSTRSSRRRSTPGSVHPRVGGEHGNGVSTGDDIHGSPPRGRGALQATHRGFERVRFTPAWAGSTPPMRCRIPRHRFTPAWAGSTAARPRTA